MNKLDFLLMLFAWVFVLISMYQMDKCEREMVEKQEKIKDKYGI